MRRYSPAYHSPPRRGYGGRGRSPPRRGYGGYGGGREQGNGSLLVRNIPMNCRPEDLRVPFERFGAVRDVYLPKDYYTGEPRGFGFVQFVDPCDAGEAQYHMNRQILFGREITVVLASESRKRPEDMRRRARIREPSGYDGRRSYHGRSRSRSRSPRMSSRDRRHSQSYSASPDQRHSGRVRSPRNHSKEHKENQEHRAYSPNYSDANDAHGHDDNGLHDAKGSRYRSRSLRRTSVSPPGSRSRSADISPRRHS